MDMHLARTAGPMTYGLVVVLAFLVLPGFVATLITIVGAMLLAMLYVVNGRSAGGRNRNRNRNRG